MEFRLPEYNEIPDVGLFLEQVQRYVASALSPLTNITITGSMISNYVKQSIIAKPVRKQYFREQIADIIFVAAAKSVLSLDSIRIVIDLQKDTYSPKDAYECFRDELTSEIDRLSGNTPAKGRETRNNQYSRLIREISLTIAHKVYLEQVFEDMKKEREEE